MHVLANLPPPVPTVTAYTISFNSPEAMANEVQSASDRPVLKLKLGGPDDETRIRAARLSAPNSELIVDANGGWTAETLSKLFEVCADNRIRMVEQPLPVAASAI